jgi:hypothetical protein
MQMTGIAKKVFAIGVAVMSLGSNCGKISPLLGDACDKGQVCCAYDRDSEGNNNRAPSCMSRHQCTAPYPDGLGGQVVDDSKCR